ncbi:centromere protein I-like [Babylonia areolata]|uniref:centromere protein I-like n=1 Tax=Babylonia areolata TaxID=304850 RepID=UPI003FD2DCE1
MSNDVGKTTLEEAVRYFAKCKSKVVVRGNIKLQLSLDMVKNAAEQTGLDPEYITILVDAAASGCFAQTVSRQLIRSLIPKSKVPQAAIIKAVSWMSTNKPAVAIQTMLIRWILVVYDYIDGFDKIHCLYGILFLFLDSQVMMPHVCHLLFLLTRKEDVKMFRVRKLLSLIQGRAGSQSCLIGLLTIYKLYYPNLVSYALPASNKTFFGSYDRKWKSQVREIVEKSASADQGSMLTQSFGTDSAQLTASRSRQLSGRRPPRKKRRLEVPVSHSASADTERQEKLEVYSLSTDAHRVPFMRIDSFVNLLQHVDKIEFPSQIAACLKDPILQHLMAYAGDRVATARFTFWLQHALTEEFLNHTPQSMEENNNLLQLLVNLTDFLQEGIPVVENFLAAFLHTWNGADYRPHIFRLLTRCHIYPFNELNDLILEPLRQLYCSSSVYFKCQCLLTLTELLKNYAVYECPRLKAWTATMSADDPTSTPLGENPNVCVLFPERLNETVQVTSVFQNLTSFIDKLAVLGLQLEGDNPLLLHIIVSYIQLLSSLTDHPGVDHIILPSSTLVRLVLFSSSTAAVSMMAAAFCRYKESFTHVTVRRRESVSTFNDMLVDICDALWRNKAFSNPLQGSLKAVSVALTPIFSRLAITYPSSRFSIFQGQAFLCYAWSFLVKTQPAGKKVHPNQLKTVKDAYLQFLQQEHLEGIIRFINTFIMRKTSSQSAVASSAESQPVVVSSAETVLC